MKVAGIVCEYNPMHNGHTYHIEKTRQAGATHIVAAMSGNFVQRGECAFVNKWKRAEIAVNCGADLVIDIPVPWSCSSAENYAKGAVCLLNGFGIDFLSFGSECDDVELLKEAACACESELLKNDIKGLISTGLSYPSALQKAVENSFSKEISDILCSPNNVLAIEYIKALEKINPNIDMLAVKRKGTLHDGEFSNGSFMSANAIRNLDNFSDAEKFMPAYSYGRIFENENDFIDKNSFEAALLFSLRRIKSEEMKKYVSDSSGLADRIFHASRTACSLDKLYETVKTKSLTMAKVRREIMNIFLEIPKETALSFPPYIRLLAANSGIVVAAGIWGKLKTAFTMVAVIAIIFWLCLCSDFGIDFPQAFRNAVDNVLVPILVWISTALTIISGAVYLKGYWHMIDSDK